MKSNRIWIGLLIVGLVTGFSGAVTWAAAADQVTVIGVVQEVKRKIYLATDKEKFMIVGQDLKRFVGRKVKATGKVIENYRGKSLMVTDLEFVRN